METEGDCDDSVTSQGMLVAIRSWESHSLFPQASGGSSTLLTLHLNPLKLI